VKAALQGWRIKTEEAKPPPPVPQPIIQAPIPIPPPPQPKPSRFKVNKNIVPFLLRKRKGRLGIVRIDRIPVGRKKFLTEFEFGVTSSVNALNGVSANAHQNPAMNGVPANGVQSRSSKAVGPGQPSAHSTNQSNSSFSSQMYHPSVNHLFSKIKLLTLDKSEADDSVIGARNKRFEDIYCFDDSEDDIREVSKSIKRLTSSNHKNYMKSRKVINPTAVTQPSQLMLLRSPSNN
jgi:hypothetical protein